MVCINSIVNLNGWPLSWFVHTEFYHKLRLLRILNIIVTLASVLHLRLGTISKLYSVDGDHRGE